MTRPTMPAQLRVHLSHPGDFRDVITIHFERVGTAIQVAKLFHGLGVPRVDLLEAISENSSVSIDGIGPWINEPPVLPADGDDESRFWLMSLDPGNKLDLIGSIDNLMGLVDEEEGGVIAYVLEPHAVKVSQWAWKATRDERT